MKIGNNDVLKIYFGDNEVSKIYLGDNEIYNSSPSPSPSQDKSLTFNVTGIDYLTSLYVNGDEYSGSDFTNGSLTLTFPTGTSISWYVDWRRGEADPYEGSFTLDSDTTINITISDR